MATVGVKGLTWTTGLNCWHDAQHTLMQRSLCSDRTWHGVGNKRATAKMKQTLVATRWLVASLQGSDAVSSEAIAAPVGPTVAFTSISNRCGTTSQPHQ